MSFIHIISMCNYFEISTMLVTNVMDVYLTFLVVKGVIDWYIFTMNVLVSKTTESASGGTLLQCFAG